MAYATRRLGPAAALAMTAVLVSGAASAETGRAALRSEFRVSPLGAGGAIDPIAIAIRKDERRIGEASGPQPSLFDRLVRRTVASAPALSVTPPDTVTREPSKRWPLTLDDVRAPLQALDTARDTSIVLAALQPLSSPPKSDAFGLPWAATPKVPALTAGPRREGSAKARETSVAVLAMPAPPPARSLMPEPAIEPQKVFLPFSSGHVRLSRHMERGLSHRREPMWRVRLPVSEMPSARDPLGAVEPPKPEIAAPAFIMPFENGRVTSLFNEGRRHPAIDLAGRHGSPVFATSSGQTVIFAASRGGYGNAVITRDAQGREHLYGHLSAIHVRPGKVLAQGERLGLLGSTGYSTGPHVHYEVKDRRGVHINPVTLLFPRGVRSGYAWAGTGLPRVQTTQTADARRP
jgi:murein DD-endopeptidase MepM/ murein hydrolase activator NlpD